MTAIAAVNMSSILNYFTKADRDTSSNVVIPIGGVFRIPDREISKIAHQIQSNCGVKRKRVTYGKLDKMKTTKHVNECRIVNTVLNYNGEFLSLTESTVCGWFKKYRSLLGANVPNSQIVMSAKRGRPLYLPELHKKLRAFITHMRMVCGTINGDVVFVDLMGAY